MLELLQTSSSSSDDQDIDGNQQHHGGPIFVDVRTAAERAVSGIQGAVTLLELETNPRKEGFNAQSPVRIVYCTIGYRSGMEAQRLQQRYPHWRIYNLDGIVAYSHALVNAAATAAAAASNFDSTTATGQPKQQQQQQHTTVTLPRIVHPETGEPVNRIHTFGKVWDYLPPQHYEGVHFGRIATLGRTLQVGGRVVVCSTQSLVQYCRPGCCHRGAEPNRENESMLQENI